MGFLLKFFYAILSTLLFLLHARLSLGTNGEPMKKCIERERKALLLFKQGIFADSGILSTWRDGDDEDCCNWKGVYCSNETGHVQILDLDSSGPPYLRGTINITLLSELHDLKHLDLSNNNFYPSDIPESIELLTNLRYLNLSNSFFVGSIPNHLGKLSNLLHIDLRRNYLEGGIPWQIGNLSKLQYLSLTRNYLVGVIPYQLGNLSMLHTLLLGNNINLTVGNQNNGDVEWMSKLSLLTNLDLSHVNNVGYPQIWLQMLIGKVVPKLRELRLRGCGISYAHNLSLSTSPSNYSSSLVTLDLSYNNLKSSLFQWPFNFSSSLQQLSLKNCNLMGDNLHLLFSHSQFPSLRVLNLSYNNLTSIKIRNCSLSSNNLIVTSFNPPLTSLVHLDLTSNNLQGEVLTSLGNICTLKSLRLRHNNLSGDLSSLISNTLWCSRHLLQTLYLGRNQLTGMLPNLSIFPFLQGLDLSYNQLKGKIPESIGLMSQLKYLYLNGNNLGGVVTESYFKNLSNLLVLSLSRNPLTLKISTSWIPPFQLDYMDVASCTIGPNFPYWIRNQHRLSNLDISDGGLSGSIPEWFWPLLTKIHHMNISYNNFVGKIPNLPLKFYRSPTIILTSNNFEGAVPSYFSQALELYLSRNRFSNLTLLLCGQSEDGGIAILDLSNNQLKRHLPNCWSQLNSLEFVDLSNNNLLGEIPSSIGCLGNIEALILRNNSLTGELPLSLVNCSKLLLLDMSKNKLSGPLPSWIGGSLRQLQILSLRMNHFYGSLPVHFCCLTQIRLFDVSHNKLSNEIPPCLQNFTSMAQEQINLIDESDHSYRINETGYYSYSDSVEFSIMLMWKGKDYMFKRPEFFLKSIDLSSNALSGEIPKELVSLLGLVSLNLSRNQLSGKIPKEIGNLKSLEFLDLSKNNLSGPIPSSVAQIDRLSVLDLSNNHLYGKIPTGTQLQSFNASCYEGNLDLCGLPLNRKCTEDKVPPLQEANHDDEEDASFLSQEFYLSLGLGFVVGFWAFVGPLLFIRTWRQAYFRFVNTATNKVHVLVAIYAIKYLTMKD